MKITFQSLTGSIKSACLSLCNFKSSLRFNPLQDQSKVLLFRHKYKNPIVSIPYRINQKFAGDTDLNNQGELFQSLTGSIKSREDHSSKSAIFWFQSLTGSIKSINDNFQLFECFTVSIPYRINQKLYLCVVIDVSLFVFQSLTGSIKSPLQTVDIIIKLTFQSLTGSIKRFKIVIFVTLTLHVSIPYRINQKKGNREKGVQKMSSFNPLQDQSKVLTKELKHRWVLFVSIPYRINQKNPVSDGFLVNTKSFQSLTGSIKSSQFLHLFQPLLDVSIPYRINQKR